jgi:hypothetical protein
MTAETRRHEKIRVVDFMIFAIMMMLCTGLKRGKCVDRLAMVQRVVCMYAEGMEGDENIRKKEVVGKNECTAQHSAWIDQEREGGKGMLLKGRRRREEE